MSSWDQQTEGRNLVWFEEIERKLAKLSKTTLLTVLPLNYFMPNVLVCRKSPVWQIILCQATSTLVAVSVVGPV
jgi:hypothetical protein